MSAVSERKNVQVKYRKIHLKDLKFVEGDNFFERGQFGDVKRAQWSGKVVAVKCFSSPDRKGGFWEELVCLSLLQKHKNIVDMHGACISDHPECPQPFIVLEFAPLSLEKVLHECRNDFKYTSDHVMSWAYQTAVGLEYIHGKEMVHRDIKPSNILLFNQGRTLKLCDFGTAKKLQHTLTNAVGTIRYMAPEVIRGHHYTVRCDVFSFAIVMWEMITRKRPILTLGSQQSNMAILYAMANGARPPMIRNLPKAVEEMITKCWDEEPHKRPSLTEIRYKLEKLCEYIEKDKPLIQTRGRGTKKSQHTQSDIFAAEDKNTQHESANYQQEKEKEEGGAATEVAQEGKGDDVPSPSHIKKDVPSPSHVKKDEPSPSHIKKDEPSPSHIKKDEPSPSHIKKDEPEEPIPTATPLLPPSPPPGHLDVRDRAATVPHRPTAITRQDEQQQLHRHIPRLNKQISSPPTATPSQSSHYVPGYVPMYTQSSSVPASTTPLSASAWPGYPHRYMSEYSMHGYVAYEDDLTKEQDLIEREQQERYQMMEKMMKRQAPLGSPFSIEGLELELQPIVPQEDSPESLQVYRQYVEVAGQVLRAKQELAELNDENLQLDREIRQDEQKCQMNRNLLQEYQARCNEKDALMKELEQLQREFNQFGAGSAPS